MMMAYYKKIISLLLFVLTCGSMFGQGTINFELGENLDLIRIDSTTNPNNIWQIGTPQKTIFDSGYMTSRAMLTDSTSNYPYRNKVRASQKSSEPCKASLSYNKVK